MAAVITFACLKAVEPRRQRPVAVSLDKLDVQPDLDRL
jgi:hypothetical protein